MPWEAVGKAARDAGGFCTSGLALHRPSIGGPGLDRVDLVLTVEGLGSFEEALEDALAARGAGPGREP